MEYWLILILIGLIIVLTIHKICNTKETFSNLKITLGVPCIPEDIPKLENLIHNVNKQTRPPDNIIIALSETNNHDSQKLQNKLNNISRSPVTISNVPHKAFSGINRNRVVDNTDADYIAFLDADDHMHPQRLELVEKVIQKYKPVGIVHGLTMKDNCNQTFDKYSLWDGKKLYNYHKNKVPITEHLDLRGLNLHHGHPIYSKKVFQNVRFTDRRRGQDAEMLRNVLDYYGDTKNNVHFLELPLSIYYPRKIITY